MQDDRDRPPSVDGDRLDDLDDLVAEYIDRLNRGEKLREEEILLDHPGVGREILFQLEAYVRLGAESVVPLGTLGDYTLRRQIGRGGMGVVYEAWENSMDRAVALKVLPAAVAADEKALQRFVLEAKVAGDLRHPNVVPIYSMGLREKTPYYAMEFVEGETLAQVLAKVREVEPETDTVFGKKDRPGYFEKLAEAFAGVADGLQHAHSKGVIHRDIKPSNLILDPEGRLRILDFGLARLEGHESLTISGDFVGTPLYMSPEQARRKRIPVDHRTDVYSLGATMYESLCGKPPFRGKDHADTLSQIIERDPTEPQRANPRVPKNLETIVLKCLRKDAGDRYGTAEALAQDMRRFVRGDPIEARPLAPWERLARRVAMHRGKLLAAAGALVLLLACGVLAYRLAIETEKTIARDYERTVVGAAMKLLRGDMILSTPDPSTLLTPQYRKLLTDNGKVVVEQAVGELERAIELLPERFEARYYRAMALRLLERKNRAIEEAERAIGCDPDFAPARVLLAVLESRNVREALETGHWGETWTLARWAMRDGRWKDAATAYGKLIAREEADRRELYLGSSIENLLGRGVARLEAGDLDGAKLDFQAARTRSLMLWGEFLEPVLLLGKAYYLEGKAARAEEKVGEVLDRSGDRDEATLWIAAVHESIMRTFVRQGRLEEAVRAGRKAVDLRPGDARAYSDLAWVHLRQLWLRGEWERLRDGDSRSREFLDIVGLAEKALELDRENPDARALHTKVLYLSGDLDGAHEFSAPAVAPDSEMTSGGRTDMNGRQAIKAAAVAAALVALGGAGRAQEGGVFTKVRRVQVVAEASDQLHSPWAEWGPSLTADGKIMVFASNRPGGPGDGGGRPGGALDLYEARRDDPDGPFQSVRLLAEVSSSDNEATSHISADGLNLYFVSGRDAGNSDLFVATRKDRDSPFGERQRLSINSASSDLQPRISVDGLELYFSSNRPGGEGCWDFYVASREKTDPLFEFRDVRPLPGANSHHEEANLSVSTDTLALFFSEWTCEPRPPEGWDLWMATRATREDDFRPPIRLPPPVSTGRDFTPFISVDWPARGSKIYWSRCVGPCSLDGDNDLYEATWVPDSPVFRRGDCNDDDSVDISDAICILDWLFLGGAANCVAALNVDGVGQVDITDPIFLLNYLFLGGPRPVDPFPDCGTGDLPADSTLGCATPPRCPTE